MRATAPKPRLDSGRSEDFASSIFASPQVLARGVAHLVDNPGPKRKQPASLATRFKVLIVGYLSIKSILIWLPTGGTHTPTQV